MISDYYPLDARLYVRDELTIRQKRRPQYSMRAFARDLEISPSFLCEFLAGRQGLSKARAVWIAEKIRLSPEQGEHFWDLIQAQFAHPTALRKAALTRARDRAKSVQSHLNLERFHLVADWFCFPLLELLGLENGPRTLTEAALILDVPESELMQAARNLEALGLLKNENDMFVVTSEMTSVGDDVDDRAVQISHQQALRMHADAVDRKSYAERENFTGSFAIAREDWPAFRRECVKAMLDVISKYGNSDKKKDDVVAFTAQMMTLMPREVKT